MAVWGPFAVQAFRDGSFRVLRSGKTRSRPATAQPADLGVYDYAPAPTRAGWIVMWRVLWRDIDLWVCCGRGRG